LPDLDKKINEFIQDKRIIDIKFTEVVSDDYVTGDWSALVMYEEKRNRHLQQQEFNLFNGEDPNEFLKNHDVVNVSTFKDANSELITVVTYEDEENDKD
jgi:hypothetical protein